MDKIKGTEQKVGETEVGAAVRQESEMAASLRVVSTEKVSEAYSDGKLIEEIKLALAIEILQTRNASVATRRKNWPSRPVKDEISFPVAIPNPAESCTHLRPPSPSQSPLQSLRVSGLFGPAHLLKK